MRRHIDHGESLDFLATQVGISVSSAYKWLARYLTDGAAALVDRRSVRRTQRRTLDPLQLQRAVDLRHERCTLRRVARVLAAPLYTVGRALKALSSRPAQKPTACRASAPLSVGTARRHDPR